MGIRSTTSDGYRSRYLFPELVLPTRNGSPTKSERLPTNTTSFRYPIHRWFNFIAGFAPEFVSLCIEAEPRDSIQRLLDPFAGCGTSLVTGCQSGIQGIGFEAHPVFARFARAKLTNSLVLDNVRLISSAIFKGLKNPAPVAELPESPRTFLRKLFTEDTLSQLLGARNALRDEGFGADDLAFSMLSKMADCCSHAQTDGIYKAPTSLKTAATPSAAARRVADMIAGDITALGQFDYTSLGTIVERSSESMVSVESATVDIIVTSPPYLNNFDFAEMARMYLYFWEMAVSWSEITAKVRNKLIVNTTTALAGHKQRQDLYRAGVPERIRPELDSLFAAISEESRHRAGHKEYHLLLYPYFAQMTHVLSECVRTLRSGAPLHLVVADAAFYGVHVSTPQLLAELISILGCRDVQCDLIRRRGHRWILDKRDGSKQGLGEYHIRARKANQ